MISERAKKIRFILGMLMLIAAIVAISLLGQYARFPLFGLGLIVVAIALIVSAALIIYYGVEVDPEYEKALLVTQPIPIQDLPGGSGEVGDAVV